MTANEWGNVAGLAGTALLVYPAIKATRLFSLAESAKRTAVSIPRDQALLGRWAEQVHENVKTMREEWKPEHAAQLFVGIALTGVSDLLPLLKAWGWIL